MNKITCPSDDDPRERRALARFAAVQMVLQAIQRGLSLSQALQEAAHQPWDGRFYSPETLVEWLYRFRRGQFAALYDQPRSDKGQKRTLDPAAIEALLNLCLAEQVICVADGEQARAYLKGEAKYADRTEYPIPNVFILDYGMPRLNGLEVLRWMRRDSAFDRLPVVVTSILSPNQEISVTRLNAAYCMKTAEPNEMHRAIREAIICAFKLASLVPEGAWYRGMEKPAPAINSKIDFAECQP